MLSGCKFLPLYKLDLSARRHLLIVIIISAITIVSLSSQLEQQAGLRAYAAKQTNKTSQGSDRLKSTAINATRTPTTPSTSSNNNNSSNSRGISFGAKNVLSTSSQQALNSTLASAATAPAQVGTKSNLTLTARSHNLDDISHRLDQPVQNVGQDYDTRVPFWNIAHMINSIGQIDLALSAGANGIETDVSFDATGWPVEAFHGLPCDCGRHCYHSENFVKFVQHLSRLVMPPAQTRLLVVLFDLKLKDLREAHQKEAAGFHLAEIIHKNIYAPYQMATNIGSRAAQEQDPLIQPPVRVILSINHASDMPLVKSFISYMISNRLDFMRQQVGFDVGMNDDLREISSAWDQLNGATFNIWQGDGLTNCANIIRGSQRLKQAIDIRNGQGHFRKVYYWTADVMYHIRSVMRFGVDAVLTNQPQRVNQVLGEEEFRHKYRLATPYDYPFEQYLIQASATKMPPPSLGEAAETVSNLHKTSKNFIKTIPDGISAVIKKVHQTVG